jgi:UDP-3-O-[3-hydroxymyristoyl] N-acetylglucosamine deacetylase
MLRQRTLKDKISCFGVGLHSGKRIKLEILPAPADHGISYSRSDVSPHRDIQAHIRNVTETTLATTLASERYAVSTVEHLLAALTGMGIYNARVRVNGPEVPILDGSAAPFVYMISSVGYTEQRRPKHFAVITRPVEFRSGDKMARISPRPHFKVSCYINFNHPLVTEQKFEIDFTTGSFYREIARARTFGFLRDVEALKAKGLAQGGSLENAVVIDDFSVLNEDGLRYPDEFVRHKALDAIGDLALFGMPVIGHLEIYKSGHWLHTQLVRQLVDTPSAYELFEASDEQAPVTSDGRVIAIPAWQDA